MLLDGGTEVFRYDFTAKNKTFRTRVLDAPLI